MPPILEIYTISPNVFAEVNKDDEKSKITLSKHEWQETIDYIISLSLAQHHVLVDWVAATKFKTTKINSGGFV